MLLLQRAVLQLDTIKSFVVFSVCASRLLYYPFPNRNQQQSAQHSDFEHAADHLTKQKYALAKVPKHKLLESHVFS